jgi:hypothetical protein
MPSQARPRKESTGIQLLSPTLQQSIHDSTSKLSSSHPTTFFGWSTTPPASLAATGFGSSLVSAGLDNSTDESNSSGVRPPEKEDANPAEADFDFDGFTLASVRGRGKKTDQAAQDTASQPPPQLRRSCSTDRGNRPADYCAYYYDDIAKPNLLSCSMGSVRTTTTTEDFEMSRRLQQRSFRRQTQRASVMSRPGGDDPTGASVTSATAAKAGFPMAKKKEMTAVAMRGWLQKRKGLVIRRWKPYYCLFKSDDTLCLYASEDTVNGRLEQRYQILRVMLTDKNDAFNIIGVDADGSPRREEFRAAVSPEWTRWFQVLGRFFDSSSIEQALVRKPELNIPQMLNEAEERDRVDNNTAPGACMPPLVNYQPYDERRSYFSQRKQSLAAVRDSFGGNDDNQSSGASAPGIDLSNLTTEASDAKPKLSDCPMIERKSQATVPLLETRAVESKRAEVAAALSTSFSWTK